MFCFLLSSCAFLDDFLGGDGSFEAQTVSWLADGLWHETANRSFRTEGTSWYYGQAGIYNYNTGDTNSGSLLATVQLSDDPTISFWYWRQTEGGDFFDKSLVQVSLDSGQNWLTMYQALDISGSWVNETVDLSVFKGDEVMIRFYFDTIDPAANDFEGWYVDEIVIQ
jgi:hypothetical protein